MTYKELCEAILTAQEELLKHKIEANSVTLNGRKYGKLIDNCPPNMKPTIFGMAVKADYALPDDYDFLVQYEPPQPPSNADCVRAMTDEEIEKWFWWMHKEMMRYTDSRVFLHDWLKQEAK